MCGIAGLLALDGSPLPVSARDAVQAMTDAMKYRGPDGDGLWQSGPVCFGHRRLSIIDIKGGSQPMHDKTRETTIVFNGEIYNFQELREKLAKLSFIFTSRSDTEVILAAYAAWGIDCLDRLEGMFAFALWDDRKKRLFCARDHFGKKPFYYSIQNGIFAFCSELDPMLKLGEWRDTPFAFTPAPSSIMRYLAYEYTPNPSTIYAQADSLEPAHYLILADGSLQKKRFWALPAPETKPSGPLPELERQLYGLLREAVRKRMVSDVPLGVFLSGGIDSSIVTGLMRECLPEGQIQSFSIGFREKSYDESRYARIAAERFGTDHHERILSADDCADELPGIISRMDTPMADASCAPTWLLSALAREHVVVALGGDGADELWAGYEHYIAYRIALLYNRLPAFVRKRIIEPLTHLLPASSGYINPRLAMATFLQGANAPDWLRVQTMLTAMPASMQKDILDPDWLAAAGADFLRDDNLYAPTKGQYGFWDEQDGATPLARAFHVYCRQFMLDDILVKVDRCSMLHSLEVRSPFLDKHVAEFAARLPVSCKLHGFRRKYLLKRAFRELLSDAIVKRNKRGFQIPVSAWLRGKLKPLLLDMASPTRLKKQGIFNPDGINKLMQAHFSQKADLRKPLWTFLVFQLWWKGHADRFKN